MTETLDLGCGTGKWPRRLGRPPDNTLLLGVDISRQACIEASQKGPNPRWICICARGEQLPLQDSSFDSVISTVALPYMNIPVVLSEIRRLLKPGGSLDATLHPFGYNWQDFLDRPPLTPNAFVYRLYVVANGLWFHLTGRVLRYPFTRRFESWQSERGFGIALRRAGFAGIRWTHLPNGAFLVNALRPSYSEEEVHDLHAVATW